MLTRGLRCSGYTYKCEGVGSALLHARVGYFSLRLWREGNGCKHILCVQDPADAGVDKTGGRASVCSRRAAGTRAKLVFLLIVTLGYMVQEISSSAKTFC